MEELVKKLAKIQQELTCKKGQTNAFGNYKYRSCEDILEAVKPLLGELILLLDDTLVQIGDRYYIKATATLASNIDTKIFTTAYAREAEIKKGMDVSQITGATSSYARKYALNGLFAIDDTKDADTQDNTKEEKPTPQKAPQAPVSSETDLVCSVCGAKGKTSKAGKVYCPNICWEKDESCQMIPPPKEQSQADINFEAEMPAEK